MEIATRNSQSLGPMQPLVSGTMLYPGRCGVWQQPVANNSSAMSVQAPVVMTELPKESIIANTDFTTTSLIAKRRLSSMKRRMQHQNGSTGSDISTESSSHSPTSSATGSPAIPSRACTPGDPDPFRQKEENNGARSTAAGGGPQDASHSSLTSSSSTTTSGVPFGRTGGQYISMASSTHPVGLLHNQIANPMLSQLQQGLNYRFLQEQSLLQQQAMGMSIPSHIEHPQPITDKTQRVSVQGRGVSSDSGSGFKWCVAHVVIAKQIQHHMKQQNDGADFHIHPSLSSSTSFQSPPNLPQSHTPPAPPLSFSTVVSSQQRLPQHHQQPQQQPAHPPTQPTIVTSAPHLPHLALMQYSLPQTTATAAGLPPGYMAIPYPSLDIQLRMNAHPTHQTMLPAHIQLASGAIPVMADSIVGLNPSGGGGSCVQVMGTAAGISLQQQQMARLAMAHGNTAIMHGPSAVAGSWVAPVPVMNSCIINHPDTMAAPWVK